MKLAVVTTNPFYLVNFLTRFKEDGNDVRVFEMGQDPSLNIWKLKELCDWADLVWCEFCQHPMAMVTNYIKNKPIVARLWRHEIYDPTYINSIKWDQVNLLLVAGDSLKDRFLKFRSGKLTPKNTKAFYNPSVDLAKFCYRDREYSEKTKLCIVGDITPRKRQLEAVQLLVDLPETTGLSIVGEFTNKEYITHIQGFIRGNNLESRVDVYGKLEHEVLPEFFHDHDIYLSMSSEETAHYAAAEAMATGCYPLLNWWPGILDVYPKAYVYSSFSKIINVIKKWNSEDSITKKSRAFNASAYAVSRFSADKEYSEILSHIRTIADENSSHFEIFSKNIGTV